MSENKAVGLGRAAEKTSVARAARDARGRGAAEKSPELSVQIPYQVVNVGRGQLVVAPAIALFVRGIAPAQIDEHVGDCARIFFRELCGLPGSKEAIEELKMLGWRESAEGGWLPPSIENRTVSVSVPPGLRLRRSRF